jgi:predicted transcriptional regulator
MTTPPALVQLLDHATRRDILRLMLADDAPLYAPSDLSKALNLDLANVVYHVTVMERASGVQLDHIEEGTRTYKSYYAPGALVKAHPDTVALALARDDQG